MLLLPSSIKLRNWKDDREASSFSEFIKKLSLWQTESISEL